MGEDITEVLEAAMLRGVNLSELSREIGLSSAALRQPYLGVWHLSPIKRGLRKRGLILSRCGDTGTEIRRAIERAKLRSTAITSQLGITRQGMWQMIDSEGREQQKKEIASLLRKMGNELLEMAED